MHASNACFALIKRSEGCRLTAYRDPGGVLTVGWGHTGADVREGLVINQAWADWLLRQDVKKRELELDSCLIGTPVTQGQYDALVSFVYNEGEEALRTSTLLRKLRAFDVAGAADEFPKWIYVHVNGKPVEDKGLVIRRRAERLMFLGNAGESGPPTLPDPTSDGGIRA